jgi:nucleotide-binding universal stress UspA family protein
LSYLLALPTLDWIEKNLNTLLAIDGSLASLAAAKYLRDLPHVEPLEITVLTVVGLPKSSLADSEQSAYAQFLADSKQSNEQSFADVSRLFEGSNATLHHLTKHGHIGNCIVTAAEEWDAQLIVMGARGISNADHLTLGSVSEYVTTHAIGSVLVVRPDGESKKTESGIRLTIAYDDSSPAKAAIQQFATFKWMKNSEVEVLTVVPIHSVQRDDSPTVEHANSPELLQECQDLAESAAAKLRSEGVRATAKVIEARHIGSQIVSLAKHRHSDLIVLGASGQSGVARALLGSVAQYVVRHSPQSVWIVRGV